VKSLLILLGCCGGLLWQTNDVKSWLDKIKKKIFNSIPSANYSQQIMVVKEIFKINKKWQPLIIMSGLL
jgi:hypothetical protein